MKNALEIHSVLNVCGEAHRLHRGEAAVIAGDGTVNLAVRSAVAVAALLGVGEAAASLLLLWEGPLGETRAVEQLIFFPTYKFIKNSSSSRWSPPSSSSRLPLALPRCSTHKHPH